MSTSHGKILVIRGGAIGDFILTLPVLAALRNQFPEAGLELLGYARTAPLAKAGRLVDAFRCIDARPLAGFFARQGELADELRHYFTGFAIIVSYLYDPDGIFQANVARCSTAQFIVGPHRPNEREDRHATDVYLKPLERLAIFDADPVPRLHLETDGHAIEIPPHPTGATHAEAAKSSPPGSAGEGQPLVALHPGSGSEEKNWPEMKWAEMIDCLARETAARFLLVGGEAEGERLDRLAAQLPPARCELARGLPLVELARQLRRCDAFIGHDSGITHLAAALNMPGLVLWGPTRETIWRPRGESMKILQNATGLTKLAVETVVREGATIVPEKSGSGQRHLFC